MQVFVRRDVSHEWRHSRRRLANTRNINSLPDKEYHPAFGLGVD